MRVDRRIHKRGDSLLFACCAMARCISFIHIACTPERTTAGAGSSSKSNGLKGIAGEILDSSYRIDIVSLGVVTVMKGVEVLEGGREEEERSGDCWKNFFMTKKDLFRGKRGAGGQGGGK
jgi:hypothetical protein